MLRAIASHEVGKPARPRRACGAIKRRSKPHDLLTEPRKAARNRLMQAA